MSDRPSIWAAALAALIAVAAWHFGHSAGLRDAPEFVALEQNRDRKRDEAQAAFDAELAATPSPRDQFCDMVLERADDLLRDEWTAEQQARAEAADVVYGR